MYSLFAFISYTRLVLLRYQHITINDYFTITYQDNFKPVFSKVLKNIVIFDKNNQIITWVKHLKWFYLCYHMECLMQKLSDCATKLMLAKDTRMCQCPTSKCMRHSIWSFFFNWRQERVSLSWNFPVFKLKISQFHGKLSQGKAKCVVYLKITWYKYYKFCISLNHKIM